MDRLYKVLKAHPNLKAKVGEQVSLSDADAALYVEAKYLEQLPEAAQDAAIEAVVKRLEERSGVTVEATVEAVFKRLGKAGVFGSNSHVTGPGIDVTADAAEKTKCFSDHLKQIVIAQCPDIAREFSDPDDGGPLNTQRKAVDRLKSVYKSVYSNWNTKATTALAESSGPSGGYTVAPEYGTELLKLAAEQSIVRPFANVKTLPNREGFYPMLNQTAAQPASGQGTNYTGGAYVSWGSEAGTISETADPNFKQVHVVTQQLQALSKISRTLMSDSFLAMDAELRAIFADAIAFEEDNQFFNGDNVGKPQGILNAPAFQAVTRATASHFKLADAANMMAKMLPRSRPNSVWIMESLIFSELVQLVDASGRVTYIPNVGSGYDKYPLAQANLALFGRPVLFTEKLKALGTQGDVVLADFKYYIVADTGTLEIAVSDQYAFNTNQLTFRLLKRVDGRPQVDAPFTQINGNTITPFVGLAA